MPRIKSTPATRAVILAYQLAPRANEPAAPTETAIPDDTHTQTHTSPHDDQSGVSGLSSCDKGK
jgi:hypothetical protein